MRKDFKNLDIYAAFQPANGAEWQKANGIKADWKTPEHIEVKPVYTKEDLEGMEHLDYAAGIPPLSLIHISEPTRQAEISYAVFCLKKKKKRKK